MFKTLLFLFLSFFIVSSGWAYLTAGKVAVTATSSSSGVSSTSQDSDINDAVGTSVNVGVPVAVTGDLNITGTYKVNGSPISATSNWNQAGSVIYYNTGNVGIGTSVPGLLLDVQGTVRGTSFINAVKVAQGSFTRDLTTSTGNVAYTGVGFKPKAIIFISSAGTAGASSVSGASISSSGGYRDSYNIGTTPLTQSVNTCIDILTGSGVSQAASLFSMDSDGFTLTWTKSGSPTGTGTIKYLAIG